nr:hypothetical protein [Bacteroides sp. AM10-21B]
MFIRIASSQGTNSVSFTDCLGAGRTLAANRVASDRATLYRSGGWSPATYLLSLQKPYPIRQA